MMTSVTAAQRRAQITQLLKRDGAVEVADLTDRFGVSAPTIRRDLQWLTDQGVARRVHGGAMALTNEPPPSPKTIPARIGRAAADLVQDNETVFLGPGRLTLEMARALADREGLAVVTNGLAVAHEVAEGSSHTLILTGGQLDREDQGLSGQLTQTAMESLRADRLFLELSGVSAVEGLTDDNLPQSEMARFLLGLGAQVVVLAAPERVGRVAAVYIGPASDAEVLVTAREADSAPLWDLTELGVRVVLA